MTRPGRQPSLPEYLEGLEHPLKAEILSVCEIIAAADSRVCGAVKWNAPSFYITEHFATLKLMPPRHVQVVLHTGARGPGTKVTVDDPDGLLKWAAADRAVVTFWSMDEIRAKKERFEDLLRAWIAVTQG